MPREGCAAVVDVTAAPLVVDDCASGETARHYGYVEGGGVAVALRTMRGHCATHTHLGFRHVELGFVGDVAHYARFGAGTEQRALRTLQHLDALEIRGVDVEIAVRQLRGLFVQVHA